MYLNKNMKIILNIMTHGDERIGLKVAKEIKKLHINEDILTVQIANPRALAEHKRFIDQDLNRSFPGKKNGNYEQRRAYSLLSVVKKADLVIDIHSTTSSLKDALIVTNMNRKTKQYVNMINPKYLLLMNAVKNKDMISYAKSGIAFEYGKDKGALVLKNIIMDIKRVFGYLGIITPVVFPKKNTETQYFNVISTVAKPREYRLARDIKNYKLVKKGEPYARNGKNLLIAKENFYPVLFGQDNYEDIFGFKAKL